MTTRRLLAAATLAAASLLAGAPPAAAQAVTQDASTRRAARQLAEEGGRLFDQGEYAEAVDRLRRAYELVPAPTIAVLEAQALVRLGRLVDAAERYEAASRFPVEEDSSTAFRRAVGEARIQAAEMRARIPQVVVVVQGADRSTEGLKVTVDDQAIPLPLLGVRRPTDPGEHVVRVTLPDGRSDTRRVKLEEGDQKRVVLIPKAVDAADAADAAPKAGSAAAEADRGAILPHQQTLGWVALGVGAAGLATGVTAGIVMMGKQSTLDDECAEEGSLMACPDDLQDDLDAFRSARTVSWIGYGVGVVGVGAGALLLLTAPSSENETSSAGIRPWVGLSQAGVRGRF